MPAIHQPEPPSSEAARLQVEIAPSPPPHRLAVIWQDLEVRADRSFFLSWSWIGTWLETINGRPDLITARRDGDVVGLALVQATLKTRHRLLPVWTLFLHQTGDEDQDVVTIEYNDVLADRRFQDEVRDACLRALIDHGRIGGRKVGEVVLGGIDGALRARIDALGRPVQERAAAGSFFVDLAALRQSGKPFPATLKSTTARRIRRATALYEARGALTLRAANHVEEALTFFERCGALHQARWTARGHPGAFAYPFYVAFHRALIRTAWPLGQIELLQIEAGDQPIGYLYNFVDRGRVLYYLSGFRFEDDNRLKPGLVCHSLAIERHRARGMDVYDFMAGDQRYKQELGEPGPAIVHLAIQRPNWMLAAERPLRRLKQRLENARRSR